MKQLLLLHVLCTNIFWFCLPTFFLTNKEEWSRIYLAKTITTIEGVFRIIVVASTLLLLDAIGWPA
jgi:hypothetical protein